MKVTEVKKIIEALLFASPIPLTQTKVNSVFSPETPNLKKIVKTLNNQYNKESHAFEIIGVAGGFQIVSKSEYEIYIQRMLKKSLRISLSAASMDCLAIIAYRQPISRYQIEAIRGVDSSGVLKNLLGKNLVKIKGLTTARLKKAVENEFIDGVTASGSTKKVDAVFDKYVLQIKLHSIKKRQKILGSYYEPKDDAEAMLLPEIKKLKPLPKRPEK